VLLSADAQELALLKSRDRNVANLAKRWMVGDSARLNFERRSPPLPRTGHPVLPEAYRAGVRSEGDPNIG